MRLALAGLVAAMPAMADPLIDDAMLLAQYADRVTEDTESHGSVVQSLDLGNGITFTCRDGRCKGWDEGGPAGGPTGCLWEIATRLRLYDEVCDLATAEQSAILLSVQARASAHVAANALPPRTLEEIEALYQADLSRLTETTDQGEQMLCQLMVDMSVKDSEIMPMLRELTAPETGPKIDALLAEPRLPVMLPCPWSD